MPHAEEIRFWLTALGSSSVFCFDGQKLLLQAIDGHQVGHELARHGQRRAIGVALALFPDIQQGQLLESRVAQTLAL